VTLSRLHVAPNLVHIRLTPLSTGGTERIPIPDGQCRGQGLPFFGDVLGQVINAQKIHEPDPSDPTYSKKGLEGLTLKLGLSEMFEPSARANPLTPGTAVSTEGGHPACRGWGLVRWSSRVGLPPSPGFT